MSRGVSLLRTAQSLLTGRTITSYEDYNRGGGGGVILYLMKMKILYLTEKKNARYFKKIFFDGRHLANCSFDDKFKTNVENDLTTVTEENSKSNDAEEFLNYDISLNEFLKLLSNTLREINLPDLMRCTQKCCRMLVKNL